MKLSFESNGKIVSWDLPMEDAEDEKVIMDWAMRNKANAALANLIVQLAITWSKYCMA